MPEIKTSVSAQFSIQCSLRKSFEFFTLNTLYNWSSNMFIKIKVKIIDVPVSLDKIIITATTKMSHRETLSIERISSKNPEKDEKIKYKVGN